MSGQATAERVAHATETAADVRDRAAERIRRSPRIALAAACVAGAITAVLARRRR